MAERFEAPDEVKAEYNRQVLGAKSGMDNRSRILDASLFWKLMAVLKGFQRKQEQEGIVWVTTLDGLIPELQEAKILEEREAQHAKDQEEEKELQEQIDFMHKAYEVVCEVLEAECDKRVEGIFEEIEQDGILLNRGQASIKVDGILIPFEKLQAIKYRKGEWGNGKGTSR